ncbi:RNase adapter RapZ [Lysobacter maris]|uniref:RNase adapter RapZ n=1 Tax=Marilutibacter maris TaxID=1605891 RepID=A0A508ATQ2_9GAMM|nr:RNase adapter RapZ [Lysobacter maris]
MSGSGKSVALKTLEDLGYYCVDNLPADLLPQFVRSVHSDDGAPPKLAVAIDVRNRHSDLANIPEWLSTVGGLGFDPHLVYFESSDEVLLRRYADTRRRHPLSRLGLPLADAIALERQVSRPLRRIADTVIDTSEMNVHQLRRHIITGFGLGGDSAVSLLFESFAYRHGVPADADFVFDARGLPNPHWNAVLRPLSGRDSGVREYLDQQPDVNLYLSQVSGFLDTWLPRMIEDTTRSYVTVAFGCTGGRHRSVYLAERMAEHARGQGWDEVAVHHRELD